MGYVQVFDMLGQIGANLIIGGDKFGVDDLCNDFAAFIVSDDLDTAVLLGVAAKILSLIVDVEFEYGYFATKGGSNPTGVAKDVEDADV